MTYFYDYDTASPELAAEELARCRTQANHHRAQAAYADEQARRWQAALDAKRAETETEVAP